MTPAINKIVGDLGTFCELNLNAEALTTFVAFEPNPLIDPIFCKHWVEHLHRKNGVKYSYGGYMENRRYLWRQTYLQPDRSIHLGIDINVPEFSLVLCPVPFTVLEIFSDTDQNGGWGQRVLVSTENGLVIFAHLYGCQLTVDEHYSSFSCIGSVAPSQFNGGWFPHLHIQGLRSTSLLTKLDGYSHKYAEMEKDYPNPLTILGL